MPLVVCCPRCGDEVTLPADARDASLLQCPYCAEVYPLQELRRHVPPPLRVVGSLGPTGEVSQVAEEQDEELYLAPLDAAPPFIVEPPEGEKRPASYALRTPRTPPARQPSKPLLEVSKIVAGGLVGLVIGQLILWWMPGNWSLSNRDPAGIGAQWGHYAPWLVPAAVRGDPADAFFANDSSSRPLPTFDPDPSAATADRSQLPGRMLDPGFSGFNESEPPSRQAQEDDGQDPSPAARRADDAPDNESREGEPATLLGNSGDGSRSGATAEGPQANGRGSADGTSSRSATLPEGSSPPDIPAPGPAGTRLAAPANSRSLAIRFAPQYDASQLMEVVERLKFTLEEWSGDFADESAELVHEALGRAAALVPFTDPAQEETRIAARELRHVLQQIARDESKLAAIARLGVDPPLTARTFQEGILVTGRVEALEPRGKLFSTILLQDDGTPIEIVSMVNPEGRLAKGGRAVVLGIVILEPAQELEGYQGPDHPVLYGSLAITVVR
jgi:hypothetical protein